MGKKFSKPWEEIWLRNYKTAAGDKPTTGSACRKEEKLPVTPDGSKEIEEQISEKFAEKRYKPCFNRIIDRGGKYEFTGNL
jgi:hypothetical protein